MEKETAALLGAAIGGCAGIVGSLVTYVLQRGRDKQGAASAIAGEIASILDMSEARHYVELFTSFAESFEAGHEPKIPNIIKGRDDELEPVIKIYLDKIGLFGGDLPERIVRYYSVLHGIRFDIERLIDGEYIGHPKNAAWLIRHDLDLWKENETLGRQIVVDLKNMAIWG
jgi:hypothetical protein